MRQGPREQLLREVAGIGVGVPYSATIKKGNAEFSGQAIFSALDGLTFEFFSEEEHAHRHIFDVSPPESELHICSLALCWKVLITHQSQKFGASESSILTINGIVQVDWLGGAVSELTSIVVGYGSIPTGWAGNAPGSYYEGYSREHLSEYTIEGLQLDYADWSVHLREIPEHLVVGGVRHIVGIKRRRTFSSCEAKIFLSDLHYFFSFLFGGRSGMVFAEGRRDYKSLWGGLGSRIPQPTGWLQNWYSMSHMPPGRHDLSDVFEAFCEMRTNDKAIMFSTITHYATSEELVERNDVAELLPAIVLSHSALEGLATWIGLAHADIRGEHFTQRGWVKAGRFPDVVARVCERLSLIDGSRHNEIKKQAKLLRDVRNSIAHVSTMHELETTDLYDAWNKSQCLVEALILRKLGFSGHIPDRTRGELRLGAQAPRREEEASDG